MLYPRLLSLFCFILMLLVGATNAAKTERYAVCDRHLQASGDESVVSFEIHVTAGAFRGISNLPVGWGLVIDNDAPWRTKVTANTGVGAASLTPEEFKKVQFVIEKNEFGDLKFNLSGTVSVTKDYEKTRQISLKMSDFSLTPAQ